MFLLTKPSERTIAKFLESQEEAAFSYAEIGATDGILPTDYDIDHNRIKLGEGFEVFEKAVKSLKNWKMFETGWTQICPKTSPIEKNEIVAVLVNHFGFWSLNATKIVYLLEEKGEIEKRGFAYGTLAEHGESGEERFSIEYHRKDESVWYDLLAFSKPNYFLAKIGYPVSRYLQKQFAEDSKRAMLKAVKQ